MRLANEMTKSWSACGLWHWKQPFRSTFSLTFRSGGTMYAIKTTGPGTALRGARITLRHRLDGSMHVLYKGRVLSWTAFKTFPGPSPLEDEKTIDTRMADVLARLQTSKIIKEGHLDRAWITGERRYGAI